MRIIVKLAFMTFNFILIRAWMYRSVCKATKILIEYLYMIFSKFTVIKHLWFLFNRNLPRFHFAIRNIGFIFFDTIGFGKCHFFFSDRSRNFFFHGDCKKNYSSLLFISFFIFIWVYNKTLNHTIAPSYFFFFSHLKWTWKPLAERLRNKKLLKLTKLF